MPRPTGTPKTGGRKKGTPNRRSTELVEILAHSGLDVPSEIVKTLPELDAKTRVSTLLELMSFLFPKRKASEHTVIGGEPEPVTKEELTSRVAEYNKRISDLESPEEKMARDARVEKNLDLLIKLRQLGR